MRHAVFAAALALMPLPLLADPAPLSAEIAAQGLSATEARLAALTDPAPPDLFALAGLRFLTGIEAALQLRWQTGARSDWSELPVLRLPIPENPAPRPFSGADLEALLTGLAVDMTAAQVALNQLGPRDFVLEIAVDDLWFDINANAARDPGESLAEVAGLALGGRGMTGADVASPVIRFDTADAAWLSAYTHFLSAFAELALAYDPAPAVDGVMASSAAMYDLWGETPPSNAWDFMFGRQVDRVAMVLNALAQQPDPERTRSAHAHLLAMVEENRRFWALVEAETDNEREWIPNDRQISGLGIAMPPGLGERWQAVLADAEKMLKGELLIPHWRYGAEAGIDLRLLFENPPRVDLVGVVQGAALLPYARKGLLASPLSWNEFSRLVQGDAMLFAVLLN
ncbi:hypothetical protein [Neotabrizicola sp. VNH66]|uniref:hypothetical protein n=1 Tax=Neotabrizicola sp. VNH66 TaxID=3400918 RepID=UPI003BFDB587